MTGYVPTLMANTTDSISKTLLLYIVGMRGHESQVTDCKGQRMYIVRIVLSMLGCERGVLTRFWIHRLRRRYAGQHCRKQIQETGSAVRS